MATLSRHGYAEMFGPTVGDRVRLADTGPRRRGRGRLHAARRRLRRGSEVRRRQDDPRRHGPGPARLGRGRRHRHHQRARHRPLGHRQGRRRDQGRPHRRARQGRQPRRAARRRHRHRPGHRDHRRRGNDPHRRRRRLAHPLHLPAADRGRAGERRDDDARRRHRPRDRHLRDDLHAGPVAHPLDAEGGRVVPDEPRLHGQGQRQPAGRARRAGRGRRLRPEAARGLGHDAGGDRQLPRRRRPPRRAGDDPHRHAQRVGLRRGHRRRVQGPRDLDLPHRGRRRRPRARHHQARAGWPT